MEFLALLIIVGAVWWGISEIQDTPKKRTLTPEAAPTPTDPQPLDPPKHQAQSVHDPIIKVRFQLKLDSPDSEPGPVAGASSQERLDISIPDRNTHSLSLAYEPYEWPAETGFRSDLNFWINHPHSREVQKRWYARGVGAFHEKLKVFGDYEGEWVRADAKVALVPSTSDVGMQVVLNGVVLHKLLPGSESLIRRMKRQQLEIRVTKCHARLEGGGTLSDGTPRGIYVALALKPFKRY